MTLGTLVITIVAWALADFADIVIPAEVALAGAALVNLIVGWATKPSGKRAA